MQEVPHILIEYENDLERQEFHQLTLNRCFQALDLVPVNVRTNYVKISQLKFEEYIINWSEIYDILVNSPYNSYLKF